MTAQNPLGAVEPYRYDKLNRLVGAKFSDGSEVRLTYEGYGDVLHEKDRHTKIGQKFTNNEKMDSSQSWLI